jgi:hypothetical protein
MEGMVKEKPRETRTHKAVDRLNPPHPQISTDDAIQNLKEQLLACLAFFPSKTASLRQTITSLLARDVHWRLLFQWLNEAGCRDKYVRKVISQILTDAGIRRRKPGAGRRTDQRALAILAYVRQLHGEEATALLGAAWRAGRAEDAAREESILQQRIA